MVFRHNRANVRWQGIPRFTSGAGKGGIPSLGSCAGNSQCSIGLRSESAARCWCMAAQLLQVCWAVGRIDGAVHKAELLVPDSLFHREPVQLFENRGGMAVAAVLRHKASCIVL